MAALGPTRQPTKKKIKNLEKEFRQFCEAQEFPGVGAPSTARRERKGDAAALNRAADIVEEILPSTAARFLRPASTYQMRTHPRIVPNAAQRACVREAVQYLRDLGAWLSSEEAEEDHAWAYKLKPNSKARKKRFIAQALFFWCSVRREPLHTIAIGNADTPAPVLEFLTCATAPIKGVPPPQDMSGRTLRRLAAEIRDLAERDRKRGQRFVEGIRET